MSLFYSDEVLVNNAQQIAERLRNVRTRQLRRIYSQVSAIYQQSEHGDFASAKSRLVLLKPQLAYAESRRPELKPLTSRLVELIDKVDDSKENLKSIYQFLQSVVGYHKE